MNVWSTNIPDSSFHALAATCADNSATKQEQAQILLNSPTNTLSQVDHDRVSWLNHHHQLTAGFVPTAPWLGGMIDGDVCFAIEGPPNRATRVYLDLRQPLCLPLLPAIQQQFGGQISHGGLLLRWSARQDVRAVLVATLPFLVKKRGRALDSIAILDIQAARALAGGTFTALQVAQLARHVVAIRHTNHHD